ncbi:MAG: bifunctional pyr operon transcriptional regulator/uracil phosphoribosyltransferase PyrR [Thiohalophilus sp.]|nr:bifunctional pyr operon transcriptional regulator/uracil phosphoribosyltransferase PyrR [Thiohalophilus sp.]MDZ7804865.1 bifunctional pyr operon transcriptional regulator/uracil phosphoribosyltransferase PyrR [Thiohalophilus sp.]
MSERRDVQTLLSQMASDLQSLLNSRHITDPAIIGIHTGGAWIAEQIHRQLRPEQPLGTLNITFYRDDFTRIGLHPQVEPSNLPFSVDDRHIVLIDDVLHTGRTIRAAMNEIFDYGRPASIILATLVERSGRELPICADVAGERLSLEAHQHVKLTGPDPLELLIQESK